MSNNGNFKRYLEKQAKSMEFQLVTAWFQSFVTKKTQRHNKSMKYKLLLKEKFIAKNSQIAATIE